MKTIIDVTRINIYMQKNNMFNWVMGGRVDGLGTIYISQATINSFFNISRGRLAGTFRPISTSVTINTYITPIFTIIKTYISPHITIIATDITPLRSMTTISYSLKTMNYFVNRKIRNWWTQQFTIDTWVMVERVDYMWPISASIININSCYMISRGRVAGILIPISTSSNNTKMINYTIVI